MTLRKKSKKDSIFSWNNQSTHIQMKTWEKGNILNIKLFEKKRNLALGRLSNKEKDAIKQLKVRTRSLPYNAFTSYSNVGYVRELRYSIDIQPLPKHLVEGRVKPSREETIQRFKNIVAKVLLLRTIFQRIFSYAMEMGQHEKITSDPRMRLKGDQADLNSDKDIFFDPERFKIDFQGYFPKWAKTITKKAPGDRTEEEIDSLVNLLRQLKAFRRYTPEMQRLMCKAIKYDRFERHRVIIRKGHVGLRFYIIYSGIVCFTLSEDDHEVFSKPTEYYNLYKGDSFGELALQRNVRRAATIVCLQRSEFLSVEKEDFYEMGIFDISRSEMESRVESLRTFDLFATWPADVVHNIAEESRLLEFRNDLVIDRNLLMTDMLYFIIRGKCHVLRLLDLTNSKKWVKLRRKQKKLYSSVFPYNVSLPCSRQGAYSRLSNLSNVTTGDHEPMISRQLSDPRVQRKTETPARTTHPRMVKSAFIRTPQKSKERSKVHGKQTNTALSQKPNSSPTNQVQLLNHGETCLKTESDSSEFGVGVFLRLDVIEKGQIAGLHGVLRTDEDTESNSNIDTRRLSLISKGCAVISVPVEVIKKHADLETIKKIKKQVKTYHTDEKLLDCYVEKSNWNTYKEVLLGKTIKEIEKRKSVGKPGIMGKTMNTARYNRVYVKRPESRYSQARSSTASHLESSFAKEDHLEYSRRLISPSPVGLKLNEIHSLPYPHKPSAMIYARGSHRNLVLVNGGIRTNTIQEELEEQLLA